MKILIVGGSSSLCSALHPILSEFAEVITAGRNKCDIQLDLNDPVEKILFPNDLDAVIHTAANFGGMLDKEIYNAEYINVLGTLKSCQAAVEKKAKHFILISSMFSCLNEKSKFHNIYALSKKHAEEIARYYCSLHSIPLTILRPSQLYGDESHIFQTHQPFFYSIIDNAEKSQDVFIHGSNDALRNYIHINDLTNIIAKVVQNKIEGIYSCMNMDDVSYSQIANAAFSAFNKKASIRFETDKPNIPDNIFDKNDSLYKIINYYPQISIEKGMKRIALCRNRSEAI